MTPPTSPVTVMDLPPPVVLARAPSQSSGLSSMPSSVRRSFGFSSALQRAVSSVSSIASSGTEATFMCQICLGLERLTDAFHVPPCDHMFCHDCLGGYISALIVDGVVRIQCPALRGEGTQRCGTFLTDDAVHGLLSDPDTIRKYERFKAARANADTRECPECDHQQVGDPAAPQMVCEACGAQYCFAHSTAHPPDEPCEAYEARCTGPDTRDLLQRTSKPCPKCKAPTYKFTGCNHMKCPRCGEDWCWLCGEPIEITGAGIAPAHYDRRNPVSACAGLQFTQDGNEEPQHPRLRRGCRILLFYSPLALPFYLLALALWVVLTPLLLPCLVKNRNFRRSWLHWFMVPRIMTQLYKIVGCVLLVVLLLVLALLLGVLLLLSLVLCLPCASPYVMQLALLHAHGRTADAAPAAAATSEGPGSGSAAPVSPTVLDAAALRSVDLDPAPINPMPLSPVSGSPVRGSSVPASPVPLSPVALDAVPISPHSMVHSNG